LKTVFVLLLATVLAGCAATPPYRDWEHRLQGNAIVLLGELHDNPEHHRLRAQVLRRALAAGWRPAIVMEQFDRERQADIERARSERPHDAQHVIDLATPPKGARSGNWNWDYYRPFVELALEYGIPLIAANLSNADTGRVAAKGYGAVFDAESQKKLRLNEVAPVELQAMQEREIEAGHCNALPQSALPAMARAQFARDAVMASILSSHAGNGAVLIAGNGHVRRDIGVAFWLNPALRARTLAVGYLETDGSVAPDQAFDAVVRTAPAQRTDPCIEFNRRMKRP
jgi:uncharacterized iron-regulated protein